MNLYRLLRNNKESGPYTLAELKALDLQEDDLIWSEYWNTGWKHPGEVAVLQGIDDTEIPPPEANENQLHTQIPDPTQVGNVDMPGIFNHTVLSKEQLATSGFLSPDDIHEQQINEARNICLASVSITKKQYASQTLEKEISAPYAKERHGLWIVLLLLFAAGGSWTAYNWENIQRQLPDIQEQAELFWNNNHSGQQKVSVPTPVPTPLLLKDTVKAVGHATDSTKSVARKDSTAVAPTPTNTKKATEVVTRSKKAAVTNSSKRKETESKKKTSTKDKKTESKKKEASKATSSKSALSTKTDAASSKKVISPPKVEKITPPKDAGTDVPTW